MPSAFISYGYADRLTGEVAQEIKDICSALEIKPVDGKGVVGGTDLAPQIQKRISDCNVLIVISVQGSSSEWVSQEIGYAEGKGVPVVMVADAHDNRGAMMAHKYKIIRNESKLVEYATDLARTIRQICYPGIFMFPDNEDHSPDESREIFNDIVLLDLFNPSRRKQDFHYDIVFGDKAPCAGVGHTEEFFSVRFRIRYEALVTDPELYIECARTEDSFQKMYNQLVRQSGSVYRYIMKTGKQVPITEDVFAIKSFSVGGRVLRVELDSEDVPNDQYIRYRAIIPENLRANLLGHQAVFEIEICTIADRQRNEFTAIFGYPVRNLDTSFISESGEIVDIDVVDVVTAYKPAVKEPLGDARRSGARVSVRGWMLPDSAVIYVWNRRNAA